MDWYPRAPTHTKRRARRATLVRVRNQKSDTAKVKAMREARFRVSPRDRERRGRRKNFSAPLPFQVPRRAARARKRRGATIPGWPTVPTGNEGGRGDIPRRCRGSHPRAWTMTIAPSAAPAKGRRWKKAIALSFFARTKFQKAVAARKKRRCTPWPDER
jgi:hypothetical protein